MYINTTTLQRVTEGEIRQAFPDTSFSVPFAPPDGYAVLFTSPTPTFDYRTQSYRETTPVQINGKWYQSFEVYDLPAEAVAAIQAQQEQSIRTTRNTKLAETDWTQLADTPADKALWAAYRQELRDVTSQSGFPWSVVWPVMST